MIIKQLQLTDFGKFHNKIINLRDGVNLVEGENEAGKTTIHKFLEGMFFGFFKPYSKNKIYTSDYDRCLPWSGSDYKGAIVYEHGGREYRLERNFMKGREWVKLYDNVTNEDLTWTLDYDQTLKMPKANKHMNITHIMYQNTISIAQLASSTSDDLIREIGELFINASGTYSAGISLNKAVEILGEERDYLGTKKQSKSPYGRDAATLAELIVQRDEAEKINRENRKKYVQMNSLEETLRQKRERKRELQNIRDNSRYIRSLAKVERYDELAEKADALKAQIESTIEIDEELLTRCDDATRRIEENEKKLAEANDELSVRQSSQKAVKDTIDGLHFTIEKYNISELEEDEAFMNKRLEQMNKHMLKQEDEKSDPKVFSQYKNLKKWEKNLSITGIVFIVLGAVCLGMGFWINSLFMYGAGLFAMFGIISMASWGIVITRRTSIEPEYERFDTLMSRTTNMMLMCQIDIENLARKYNCATSEELQQTINQLKSATEEVVVLEDNFSAGERLIEELIERIQKLTETLGENRAVIDDVFRQTGCTTREELAKAAADSRRRVRLASQYETLYAQMQNILGGIDYSQLAAEAEQARSRSFTSDMANEAAIDAELEELNEDILSLTGEFTYLSSSVKESEAKLASLSHLNEEITALQNAITEYDEDIESYNRAINIINELSTEIRSSFSEEFNENISRTISEITNGKYSNVSVGDHLEMQVLDKAHNQLVNLNSLSGGTVDQLYFAMRFAIMDLIIADKTLPVFLDDCLAQYDENRLRNVLWLVYNKSINRQIIIFTCRTQENDCLKELGASYNYIKM